MATGAWIEQVKTAVDVHAVASFAGMRRARMSSYAPCPACRADRRAKGDARGPVGYAADGKRWHCWACNVGGDVVDLVAYGAAGKPGRELAAAEWATVRASCVEARWCEPEGRPGGRGASSPSRPSGAAAAGRVVHVRGALGRGRAAPETTPDPPEERGHGGPFAWRPTLAEECEACLWSPAGAAVLAYLREGRRFSDATIRAWRLGAMAIERDGVVRETWLTIPVLDAREEVVNVRFRSVPGACGWCAAKGCDRCKDGQVRKGYRVCAGRTLTLYGIHTLSDDLGSFPIVVEGELDVVALYELGYTRGVVSGTGGAKTWREAWLDALEPYAGFVVCYDDDDAGNEGATLLADKLGRYRCARATLPRKDAGDCLAGGVPVEEVRRAIDGAAPMVGVDLVRVDAYADEIERIVASPGDLRGRPTGSPKLDRVLGGLRPGLIVLTGETGQGKTSVATWLLFEQARAGVPSLLTSFEQSPIGTTQKLLRAQLGGDFLAVGEAERRAAMAEIGRLPLWIVKHRGHLNYETMIDTVRYAVRRLDVRNVLIDHLGFVVDPDSEDERREIQKVVRALSLYAEHEGVTVILVCHPSNQAAQQRRRVNLSDLKGASAIRQDAHEVWVVEAAKPNAKRPWPGSWIHLDKIRSDFGASGSSVMLAFDPLSVSYADTWDETPSGRRGVRPVVPSPTKTTRAPMKRTRGKGKAEATADDDQSDDDKQGDATDTA